MTVRWTARRLARPLVALVLAASLACGGAVAPGAERSTASAPPPSGAAALDEAATDAARHFLDRHLEPDGRVVRHDHGGDTVSEGQAYGMLLAVALDDRPTFDTIWRWTRENLQRDDGLLAWRWDGGRVVDDTPATDADVDAAHALALAATSFRNPSYGEAAAEIADGVVAHEVVPGRLGPVAVAGPWAVEDRWVNPSYGDPVGFAALAELTGDPTWEALDDSARRVAVRSATVTDLPPDWAMLTPEAVEPRGAPSGGRPRHGYDAARVAIRFAAACEEAGTRIAASMADEYGAAAGDDGKPPAVLDLSGDALVDHGHPVMTVAHAASLHASGDRERALALLSAAAQTSMDGGSYYGDAWIALGRLWLTTDRLGGCATS